MKCLKVGALLISNLFKWVVLLRALLYRARILPTRRLKWPVISVGSLTVGGTGKTPLVAYLTNLLQRRGYQPVILSRGYGGKAENSFLIVSEGSGVRCEPQDCGDEPFLLAHQCPGAAIIVGKDRYRAGSAIQDRFEKAVFLLDDGFQHLPLYRDLNILVLDATDPFGGEHLLPLGRLREPVAAMARADWFIVTRSDFAADFDRIEREVRKHNPLAPLSYFHHDVTGMYELRTGRKVRVRDFFGKRVIALAAIGNPAILLRDLEHYQMRVEERFLFRDHHPFRQSELDPILRRFEEASFDAVVTTEKDATRLRALRFAENQIFVVRIEAKAEDPDEFRSLLLSRIQWATDRDQSNSNR